MKHRRAQAALAVTLADQRETQRRRIQGVQGLIMKGFKVSLTEGNNTFNGTENIVRVEESKSESIGKQCRMQLHCVTLASGR